MDLDWLELLTAPILQENGTHRLMQHELTPVCRNITPIPVQTTVPLLSDASRLQQFLRSSFINSNTSMLSRVKAAFTNVISQTVIPRLQDSSVDSQVSYNRWDQILTFYQRTSSIISIISTSVSYFKYFLIKTPRRDQIPTKA